MSYEHCEKHDLPSTNGCVVCTREDCIDLARRAVAMVRETSTPLMVVSFARLDVETLRRIVEVCELAVDSETKA